MNGYYPSKAVVNIGLNRTFAIRAEYGVPEVKGSVYKPSIVLVPAASGGNPPGNFMQLSSIGDTAIFKNVMIAGYDEGVKGNLDALQGALITMPAVGAGSIFIDSCIMKSINGQIVRTDGRPNTVRITNSVFADMGFEGTSNFGAGKGIDLRGSEVDTMDLHNNTFVNWQDRIIRHYLSTAPLHNLFFNHNTCINGMSFHGFLSLGWCDSTGNGTFQIKNNLLIDHFALGSDTDIVRQAEYTDPGELDALNGNPRMAWILARPNPSIHWNISNNYYVVSDSGEAMRSSLTSPYVPRVYTGNDPYLPYGMNARLQALGGDSVNCFKKVSLTVTKAPQLMTKLIRWYRLPRALGGAGKEKRGASGVGDPNFVKSAPGVWTFDYDRHDAYWYTDSLNANVVGPAATLGSLVTTDGVVIGDPRWNSPAITTTPVTVSKTQLQFGTIRVGLTKKDSVQISNIGPATVHFTVSSSKTSFTLSSSSITLAPSTSQYVVVTFTPADTNAQSGYVKLTFDAIGSPDSIAVSGKGSPAIPVVLSGSSLNFGDVMDTKTKKDSIKATNIGPDVVHVTVASTKAVFTVVPTSFDLSPSAEKYVVVTFSPTDVSTQSGFVILSYDIISSVDSVSVGGTGTQLVGVRNPESSLPKEFSLSQNYPNPFNPSTQIAYAVPKESKVTLEIFDILGRKVATLVNGVMQPGFYTANFNASSMSSGIYIYRLSSPVVTFTRKMMLLK